MRPRRLILFALALVAGFLTSQWIGLGNDTGASRTNASTATSPDADAAAPGADPAPAPTAGQLPRADPSAALVIRNVTIRDTDGRVAFRGDVDLAPELARIRAGTRDPHRNDGGIFGNREGRLPAQDRGYYHEYVVRTRGISHAGPQRLILGAGGEVWYTFDHYESFRRIR